MRIGEGVEWAAHCTVVMAALPEGAALPASRLAEFHGVPGPYLAKSLQALARAGIVTSTAGRRGGYRLGRPAQDISLLDIVWAIEGEDPLFRCSEIRQRGPAQIPCRTFPRPCGIAAAMWAAELAWQDQLRVVTVADLATAVMEQVPEAALQKAAQWVAGALAERA
jgi:Rrf2 family protein